MTGANAGQVLDPSGGANQSRARAYNERLVLSLIRRHGELSKAELAQRCGLTAQTISGIIASLERDGLLLRGEPRRGKVGQPSIPMRLNPDGALSFGLKIGRRSAELMLMDFAGGELAAVRTDYTYPLPDTVLEFAASGVAKAMSALKPAQRTRMAGIGIATPFQLWDWAAKVGAPEGSMDGWRSFDLATGLERRTGLRTETRNDATCACGAELTFGRGSLYADFAYLFVGTFAGGGIVLDHTLVPGRSGNAGALGTMPCAGGQLIDHASLLELERLAVEHGLDAAPVWAGAEDWSSLSEPLESWMDRAAPALAEAVVSACCVIDFQAVVLDGAMPATIRAHLLARVERAMDALDLRGIDRPQLVEGTIGARARTIGAAGLPLSARYLLDRGVLFKEAA